MAKIDKKIKRAEERLEEMESALTLALTQKTSDTREINVPDQTRKIGELRKELAELKKKK